MLVGRLAKETTDLRRVTVDFSPWIDTGEAIVSFTAITVANLSVALAMQAGTLVPADPTPLVVESSFLVAPAQVQMFLAAGTPGTLYQLQFIGVGSSSRQQTIELIVTVTEAANAALF